MSSKNTHVARLGVEALEAREVPAVTTLGGPVLGHVEVQGLYYGADWNTPAFSGQRAQLDGFLQYVVNSPYMDMLSNAGYNVGRGSFTSGKTDPAALDKSVTLNDSPGFPGSLSWVQNELQSRIKDGTLASPDNQRLYVVFVEDNVAISHDRESSNVPDANGIYLYGYHNTFPGYDATGHPEDIRYAVIAYPGKSAGSGASNNFKGYGSWLDQMTETASHEIAEATTDPDVSKGWRDYSGTKPEIGDPCGNSIVYLNGYAVQRVIDKNDQPMTPRGALYGGTPISYTLQQPGLSVGFGTIAGQNLYVNTGGGPILVDTGVISVSPLGIDTQGKAMIDYVRSDGKAFEYHAGSVTPTPVSAGVSSAAAGQGVSYLLGQDGIVYEYDDAGHVTPTTNFGQQITSISAGTDVYGVNMVVALTSAGHVWYRRDSDGVWHDIGGGIKLALAERQGVIDLVGTNGDNFSYFAGGVYVVGNDGNLWKERVGWQQDFRIQVDSNVQSVTQGNDGYIYVLHTDGSLWRERPGPQQINGATWVDSSVRSFIQGSDGSLYVLGTDGNLWKEQVGWQQSRRTWVDSNVRSFSVGGDGYVYVVGTDGNLWKEQVGWQQSYRTKVDSNVRSFSVGGDGYVYVVGNDGNLWKEQPGWQQSYRTKVDSGVQSATLASDGYLYVLHTDASLWRERPNPQATNGATKVDSNVRSFSVGGDGYVYVLGTDGNLWKEQVGWQQSGLIWVDSNVRSFTLS